MMTVKGRPGWGVTRGQMVAALDAAFQGESVRVKRAGYSIERMAAMVDGAVLSGPAGEVGVTVSPVEACYVRYHLGDIYLTPADEVTR